MKKVSKKMVVVDPVKVVKIQLITTGEKAGIIGNMLLLTL